MNNHDNYIMLKLNWIEIFQTYQDEGINSLFSI